MTTVDQFKVKARALARSGHFYGLPPLEFELRFEEGFLRGPRMAGACLDERRTRRPLPEVENEP